MVQIDIKMPEKCGLCPCFHAEHPMYCQLISPPEKTKRIVNPYGLPRPDWCPLIDVVTCGECKYAVMTIGGDLCKYCLLEEDGEAEYYTADYSCGCGERIDHE